MGWTAPRTWTTGELVTASLLNICIRDNQDYIKTEIDRLDVMSTQVSGGYTNPSGTRVLNTVYQNTSGKIRQVLVEVAAAGSSGQSCSAKIGSSNPPTTTVGGMQSGAANAGAVGSVVPFWVPPSWYYYVLAGTPPTLINWVEQDLH